MVLHHHAGGFIRGFHVSRFQYAFFMRSANCIARGLSSASRGIHRSTKFLSRSSFGHPHKISSYEPATPCLHEPVYCIQNQGCFAVQSTTSENYVPWVANSAPGRSVDGCIRSRAIFVIGIPTGGRGAYIPRSQFVEGLIVARVRLVVRVLMRANPCAGHRIFRCAPRIVTRQEGRKEFKRPSGRQRKKEGRMKVMSFSDWKFIPCFH